MMYINFWCFCLHIKYIRIVQELVLFLSVINYINPIYIFYMYIHTNIHIIHLLYLLLAIGHHFIANVIKIFCMHKYSAEVEISCKLHLFCELILYMSVSLGQLYPCSANQFLSPRIFFFFFLKKLYLKRCLWT